MAGSAEHRERVKLRVKDRERLREIIKAEDEIRFLQDVRTGKIEPTPAQMKAAEVLLRKVLPDLATVEAAVDPEQFTIQSEPFTPDQWAERHAPGSVGKVQ